MTKQTKLELVQINARLAADNAALRTQVADLEHNARIAGELVEMLSRPTQRVARHMPAYAMPAWQQERAANMAAARAAAMASNCVVRV